MNPEEAQAALAGVRSAEGRLAGKVAQCPPWRHAAFGGVLAILIGSIAISTQAQIVGTVIVLALIVLIVQSDRRRYGVFVNGYRRGKTRSMTLVYLGAMTTMVAAAMYMRVNDFTIWSKLALALIAFALGTAISVKWQAIFRRELEGGAR